MQIPAFGSLVYYFPQGHAEHAGGATDVASVSCGRPYSLCRVTGVRFLASLGTDEVYARMRLDPRETDPAAAAWCASSEDRGRGGGGVVSFAKVLTPSDANNGGGFSVPRFCADSIFPPLDYGEDPPPRTDALRPRRARGGVAVPAHLPGDAAAAPPDDWVEQARQDQEADRRRLRGLCQECLRRTLRRASPDRAICCARGVLAVLLFADYSFSCKIRRTYWRPGSVLEVLQGQGHAGERR